MFSHESNSWNALSRNPEKMQFGFKSGRLAESKNSFGSISDYLIMSFWKFSKISKYVLNLTNSGSYFVSLPNIFRYNFAVTTEILHTSPLLPMKKKFTAKVLVRFVRFFFFFYSIPGLLLISDEVRRKRIWYGKFCGKITEGKRTKGVEKDVRGSFWAVYNQGFRW